MALHPSAEVKFALLSYFQLHVSLFVMQLKSVPNSSQGRPTGSFGYELTQECELWAGQVAQLAKSWLGAHALSNSAAGSIPTWASECCTIAELSLNCQKVAGRLSW